MTFYENLVLAMKARNISAAELSAKTGIYQSYFSKLKKGSVKDVTWEKAIAIITALDMTPDEFMELGKKA